MPLGPQGPFLFPVAISFPLSNSPDEPSELRYLNSNKVDNGISTMRGSSFCFSSVSVMSKPNGAL